MRQPLEATEYEIPGGSSAAEVSRPEATRSEASSSVPKPAVLLDLYHVKIRLYHEARQTHPACRPWQSNLGKAMAIPDPRAMEEFRQAVGRLHPELGPREVEQFMLDNYALVLKHVPRLIPTAGVLLERFDNVNNAFRDVEDITTGEWDPSLSIYCCGRLSIVFLIVVLLDVLRISYLTSVLLLSSAKQYLRTSSACVAQLSGDPFFTRRLKKAEENLRPHIAAGCVSDLPSDFLPVYTCTGTSPKYGIHQYRSARGSSNNENYHKALSAIMGGHQTSPQLACSIAVVHNHRRNHRMAGR